MKDLTLTPEERQKLAYQHTMRMKKALEDYGLSTDEIMDRFQMDKDSIYLINISSDPSLANQLFYFLNQGSNGIGTEKDNTITIKGLGI